MYTKALWVEQNVRKQPPNKSMTVFCQHGGCACLWYDHTPTHTEIHTQSHVFFRSATGHRSWYLCYSMNKSHTISVERDPTGWMNVTPQIERLLRHHSWSESPEGVRGGVGGGKLNTLPPKQGGWEVKLTPPDRLIHSKVPLHYRLLRPSLKLTLVCRQRGGYVIIGQINCPVDLNLLTPRRGKGKDTASKDTSTSALLMHDKALGCANENPYKSRLVSAPLNVKLQCLWGSSLSIIIYIYIQSIAIVK